MDLANLKFRYNDQDKLQVPKLQTLLEHLIAVEAVTMDDVIEALAALTMAADTMIYFTSATAAASTPLTAYMRTLLDDPDMATALVTLGAQPSDTDLTSIASLTSAADKMLYATGAGTWALTDISSVARTLIAQNSQANMRSTGLGLGTIATQASNLVSITGGSITNINLFSVIKASFVSEAAMATFSDGGGRSIAFLSRTANVSNTPFFIQTNDALTIRIDANDVVLVGANSNFTVNVPTGQTSVFQVNAATVATVANTGLDVVGESRCDTLRIDATPTAETPTPTHTFQVSLNGTTYRVPCVI